MWTYKAGVRAWRSVTTCCAKQQVWFWWRLGHLHPMRCWCRRLCAELPLAAAVPAASPRRSRAGAGCLRLLLRSSLRGQKWPCCWQSSNGYTKAESPCHTGLQVFCHECMGLYMILVVIYVTWLYMIQCPLTMLPVGLSDFLFLAWTNVSRKTQIILFLWVSWKRSCFRGSEEAAAEESPFAPGSSGAAAADRFVWDQPRGNQASFLLPRELLIWVSSFVYLDLYFYSCKQ